MKINETAGTDSLQAEGFKYGEDEIKKKNQNDCNCDQRVRGRRKVIKWNKGIICRLCRKGEKMDCTNFIGVTLYIVAY